MATSPTPFSKLMMDSRAPLSMTFTLRNTPASRASAAAASPRGAWVAPRSAAPYRAQMFHMAPPLVRTLGVRTASPGRRRSSQPCIPSGLPWRTASTTRDRVTIPWLAPARQSWVMSPAWARVSMSGSSDRAATSASKPPTMARAWAPLPR